MENTERVQRLPSTFRRILWIALAVVLVVVIAVVWWFVATYRNYDGYVSQMKQAAEVTEGAEFEAQKDELKAVSGYDLAAQNEAMALYVKPATGEIAVCDRRTGGVFYSNPPEADKDKIAGASNKENLKSQFVLTWLDVNSKEGTPWSSYAKSAANDGVKCQALDGGVRVVYTLTNEKILLVPNQLNKEWFDILSEGGRVIGNVYQLDEESGLYVRKSQGVTKRQEQQVDQLARQKDFTLEDLEAMNALRESEAAETAESLSFVVTLDWQLTEDGVQVTMPSNGLEEHGGGQIRAIQLLPFFGAAGMDETGDLVVPDGSGAVIHFNNGRNATQYNQNIYDLDLVDADYAATQNTQMARLALYGICREDSTILATCERGATLANIVASVSGYNNSYNYAYFNFALRRVDNLVIAGEDVPVAERNLYPVDCSVRYTILGSDYAGYSGVARACRERLVRDGVLKAESGEAGDAPFMYDVIGGVKETAHWLGVPYLRVLPMTTFAEAEEIMTEIKHADITNQRMNLQGWMNGGYYHDALGSVRVLGQLGGEKGLKQLQESVLRSGGGIYPDAALQMVTLIAKGFFSSEEASRYYAEGYTVELGAINPITLRRTGTMGYSEVGFRLLSPKFLPRYAKNLADAADRLKLTGLGLRDLGSEIHADKRRTNVINREAALDITREAFKTLDAPDREMLVSGGNDYSFGYADWVINAPVEATMFAIIDEEIPLWEMIVHGSIGYAGSALNLTQSENMKSDLLRLVEYGAGTHYTFTWRDSADMKYTGLNSRYATTFAAWKDEAVEAYRFVNGALKAVGGAAMTDHAKLDGGVARTTYSNGVTIYVNRGAEDAEADGQTVPALSYLVVGGEAK